MQARMSNADRAEQTRNALIAAGRALFLEKGYEETGTPLLVAGAGVTRGALYHHFEDKRALFRAVVENEAYLIAAEIECGSAAATSALEALRLGGRAYFRAMRDPARARLMLIEGPAVLGANEMRRIDLATGAAALRRGLEEALAGSVGRAEVEARADLISAMFDRAVLARANGGPKAAYEQAIDALLNAIVTRASSK